MASKDQGKQPAPGERRGEPVKKDLDRKLPDIRDTHKPPPPPDKK